MNMSIMLHRDELGISASLIQTTTHAWTWCFASVCLRRQVTSNFVFLCHQFHSNLSPSPFAMRSGGLSSCFWRLVKDSLGYLLWVLKLQSVRDISLIVSEKQELLWFLIFLEVISGRLAPHYLPLHCSLHPHILRPSQHWFRRIGRPRDQITVQSIVSLCYLQVMISE